MSSDSTASPTRQLAEAVLSADPEHTGVAAVMVAAHDSLLGNGGDESFWESGWLHHQRTKWAGG